MTWRCLLAALAAALLLPASGSAKQVTALLAVGADGRSVNVGGGWPLLNEMRPLDAAAATRPDGSYLLLYPLMEGALPMQPGRYYPASATACWSWSLLLEGCLGVAPLSAPWPGIGDLTLFSSEPTTLQTLSHADARYTIPSNASVAIELALLRSPLARPASHARCAWRLDAKWQGPAAAARPRSLCLRAKGISASGRLYPLSRYITQWLRTVG